ncbi:MAG: hypothetical protein DMG48_03595 [Acidobacteria bacterium]|nr:MAG: hypothetical protein DMG48_03595 [Acidobacteriota bacterium]
MPFQIVREPIAGPLSFARSDDAAILTQAAVLLAIGAQLRGDNKRFRVASGGPAASATIPDEELKLLGLPPLGESLGRIDSAHNRQLLFSRYKLPIPSPAVLTETVIEDLNVFTGVAKTHFTEGSSKSAIDLMEICLRHRNELVRVSAAAAYSEHSSELDRLIRILDAGTHSTENLVRSIAATALTFAAPDNARLKEMQGIARQSGATGAGHTTMLIHGTWAQNSPWWQPGGDFHTYILQSVRPDLYSKQDRFGWSGGYSDAARALAASDLVTWVQNHKEQGLDLITHSHGGNIVFLATQNGLDMGELILLSCPVHVPKYQPDMAHIHKKVVSIRVHFDLVILADRGGQRFNFPGITENVLPIWFDHFATHNPDVWRQHNVPAMI